MTKLKNPLLSLGAIGRLTRAITFTRRRKTNIAEKTPIPDDVKSLAQLSWRHMYIKAVALWHALSAAEKQEWESLARRKHMTGFAWFMSQALKPNPGLYLPLQGGIMQGHIEMAGWHIHGLPLPIHPEDVWRRIDSQTYIEPYLLTEGARVSYSLGTNVPDSTETTLPFDEEDYDTDNIHDNTVNNSRLTCKTAGKYMVVFYGFFVPNAVGRRWCRLRKNNALFGYQIQHVVTAVDSATLLFSAILELAVNDYLEITVYQTSGGALVFSTSDNRTPYFMMQRIGG